MLKVFLKHWSQGRSAIRRIQQFDPSALSVQIAAEMPDYDPLDYFPAKRLDLLDRFSQFALLAAKEAMDSSGIQLRDEERPRFGVVTGTGMGGATRSNPAITTFSPSKRRACIPLPSPRSCTTRPPRKSAWSLARRDRHLPPPPPALPPGTPSAKPST